MRFSKTTKSTQVSQKNRKIKFPFFKKKLKHGTTGFYLLKTTSIEPIYLRFIRPLLKKIIKARNVKKKLKKFWLKLKTNFPVSKKSKNSRMGKGKGSFLRWIIKLTKYTIFLESTNISTYLARRIITKLNFKFLTKIFFFSIIKILRMQLTIAIKFHKLTYFRKKKKLM